MKEELNKAKKTIQELYCTIKRLNIMVTEDCEGIDREAGMKDVFNEVINGNFPSM